MRVNLTKKYLEGLKPAPKRYQVLDAEVRGFGVVVFPSGEKSFFHCRKVRGYPERKTIASAKELSLEDARAQASKLNGELAKWRADDYKGRSPIEPRNGDPRTFGELVDFNVDRRLKVTAKNPERAEKRVRYLIDPYLADWKSRPIGSITKRDVLDKHQSIIDKGRGRRTRSEHGKVQANHVVKLVRTIFYFGMDSDVADAPAKNPAARIKLPKEHKRKERIQDAEFQKFFAELETEANTDLRMFVYLALFTAVRSENIRGAKWADMNLDAGTWQITNPKMGEDAAYTAFLHPFLVELLRARKKLSDKYLFPSFGRDGYRASVQHGFAKFAKRAGVERLHPHDLRRSLASCMGDLNITDAIIGAALGHKSPTITGIYNRVGMETVKQGVFSAVDRMLGFRKQLAVVPMPAPVRRRKSA